MSPTSEIRCPIRPIFVVFLIAAIGAQTRPARAAEATPLPLGAGGGAGSVSPNRGSFDYVYPIDVPSGPRGLRPHIALGYSSQNTRRSMVGLGWSFELGSIVRVGENGGSPAFDDTDSYVLSLNGSGQRLVFDTNDGRYHTRNQSFMHIRAPSSSGGEWALTDTRGTIYRFGGAGDHSLEDPNGRVGIWLLHTVEDTFGNRINYDYLTSCRGLPCSEGYNWRPREVTWSGYRVKFEYKLRRSDPADSNSPIQPFWTSTGGVFRRSEADLTRIRVEAVHPTGSVSGIRSYRLDRKRLSPSNTPFLEAITQEAPDGTAELPPVRFSRDGAPADPGDGAAWPGKRFSASTMSYNLNGYLFGARCDRAFRRPRRRRSSRSHLLRYRLPRLPRWMARVAQQRQRLRPASAVGGNPRLAASRTRGRHPRSERHEHENRPRVAARCRRRRTCRLG